MRRKVGWFCFFALNQDISDSGLSCVGPNCDLYILILNIFFNVSSVLCVGLAEEGGHKYQFASERDAARSGGTGAHLACSRDTEPCFRH